MKKILVPLATGFEEIEFVSIVDVLRRADLDVTIASISKDLNIKGAHAIEIKADLSLITLTTEVFDAIILPGGMPGTTNLLKSTALLETIRTHFNNSKLIGAICAAPWVLDAAGILAGRKATIYPGMKDKIPSACHTPSRVVVDKNIVTGQGPGTAIEFALTLVEQLSNSNKANELKKTLIC